jgi:ABC-type iron transport system FetAB ATPase subunit
VVVGFFVVMRGDFVVIDGADGVGKSVLERALMMLRMSLDR